jgi:hypothetical protein
MALFGTPEEDDVLLIKRALILELTEYRIMKHHEIRR